ncbi:MAG TPA: hypothetical protein VHS96_15590, partial [Bacteroidia bacterium]|nr:hypothetical protein [Bacteroidia bacterium]
MDDLTCFLTSGKRVQVGFWTGFVGELQHFHVGCGPLGEGLKWVHFPKQKYLIFFPQISEIYPESCR